ncbi:MAG: Mov34/MPN/PAD-1 family protein [Prevotella sp.]|nr:Mov34/MPN/PAD-1 family protein [Prevotella sp.]
MRILANWHSHPASPSRPSEEDLRLALDPTILREVIESSIRYRIRIHQRDPRGRHTSWHHGHS